MSIVKCAAIAATVAALISLPTVSMAHSSRDEGTATHTRVYNTTNKPAVMKNSVGRPAPASEPWFLNDHSIGVG